MNTNTTTLVSRINQTSSKNIKKANNSRGMQFYEARESSDIEKQNISIHLISFPIYRTSTNLNRYFMQYN